MSDRPGNVWWLALLAFAKAAREWLAWRLAGPELLALARYRKACALAWRWNGGIPASAETADWIREVGEDKRGADIEQFRERLRAGKGAADG